MMKTKQIIGLGLVSAILFSSGTTVFAEDTAVSGQSNSTGTFVDIVDDTSDPDPLDPTDPTQKHLTLEHVPTKYNFTSVVSNKQYSISSGTIEEGTIDVFNDRSSRNWAVKASVEGDKLTKENDSYTVTEFEINDISLATGVETTVASNPDNTTDNNTGLIKKAVNNVAIKFEDTDNKLKAGDTLSGAINYKLYLVPSDGVL